MGAVFEPLLDPPPLWRELLRELKDRLHPAPQPELRLSSPPLPVKDIWSRPDRRRSRATSLAVHGAALGLLALPLWRPVQVGLRKVADQQTILVPRSSPMSAPRRLAGGGAPHITRAALPLPRTLAPMVPTAAITFPQTEAPVASLFSGNAPVGGPPGSNGGSSGIGPGGPGSGTGGGCLTGPCGNGLSGLTMPVPLFEPAPEYSDEARKAKFQGTVILSVRIGTDGRVYDPKIITGVGYGLDERAVEAVRNWRFEPARQNGRAVEVAANVEVNFHLY